MYYLYLSSYRFCGKVVYCVEDESVIYEMERFCNQESYEELILKSAAENLFDNNF